MRGQKAALVINLYYEEERQMAKIRQVSQLKQGEEIPDIPNLDERENTTTNEVLATKAGVGKSNIAYLIAVKKKRPDLFEKVFNGNYSINSRNIYERVRRKLKPCPV